jgi:uncharacterized protein (TIGR02996 family)
MNFRQFLSENIVQMEAQDFRFLTAILENATDQTIPLVFADWLEERGRQEGPYIRAKVEKQKLPKEFIPMDNWFFQGVKSEMNSKHELTRGDMTPATYANVMAHGHEKTSNPKYRRFWEPIVGSKRYRISGGKIAQITQGHYSIDYSPVARVFYVFDWVNFWDVVQPNVETHWMMAVNALKLEKVIR